MPPAVPKSYLDTSVVISLITHDSCHKDTNDLVEEAPEPHCVSTWTLAEALGRLSEGIRSGNTKGYRLLREKMARRGIPYLSTSSEVFNYLTERLSEWITENGVEVCDDLIDVDELEVGDRPVRAFWAIRDAAELAARLGLKAADAMHLAYVRRLCPGLLLTVDSDFTRIAEWIRSLGIEVRGSPCKKGDEDSED
jgi:predicted nucleic acid-binding protein